MQAFQEVHIDDKDLFVIRLNKQTGNSYTAFSCFYHQLVLVIHPTGNRIIEDQFDTFSSMDLVLLPPGCHCCWNADFTTESMIVHILFDDCFSSEALFCKTALKPVKNLFFDQSEVYIFSESAIEKVKRKLFLITDFGGIKSYYLFFSILNNLAHSECQRRGLFYESSHPNQRIHLVFDYVRKNFRNEFTLNEVASLINLTPKSFCRYFKQQTSTTFIDYLNRIRIQEAMRLLHKEKGKVISTVGYACDFNSASNFRKTFEKVKGMSPTAYRMKIRG